MEGLGEFLVCLLAFLVELVGGGYFYKCLVRLADCLGVLAPSLLRLPRVLLVLPLALVFLLLLLVHQLVEAGVPVVDETQRLALRLHDLVEVVYLVLVELRAFRVAFLQGVSALSLKRNHFSDIILKRILYLRIKHQFSLI